MPASDLEVVHNKALAKFEAAEVVLRGTKTTNADIVFAKKALYQAETIDEYMAAAKLFEGKNTASQNPRIDQGRKLVKAAAEIVKKAGKKSLDARPVLAAVDIDDSATASPAAGSRAGGAAAKQAASPAAASPQKKASPPAAAAVKHEASPAPAFPRVPLTARVVESAPAHVSLLDRSARVVLSAAKSVKLDLMTLLNKVQPAEPAGVTADAGDAAVSEDDKPLKPRRKKRAAAGGVPKGAQKRRAAEVPSKAADDFILITSSDEDDDKGKQPAAGGAAKSVKPAKAAQVVYAQNNGFWTSAVIDIMTTLKKRGFYSFQQMSSDVEDQLATLPEQLGLACLAELLHEHNVFEDANAFVIERAEQLRAEHGIAGVFEVYGQIAAAAAETESDSE